MDKHGNGAVSWKTQNALTCSRGPPKPFTAQGEPKKKFIFLWLLLGCAFSTAPWWSQIGGERIMCLFPSRRHWDPLKSLSGYSKCMGRSSGKGKLWEWGRQHWSGLCLLTCAEVWYQCSAHVTIPGSPSSIRSVLEIGNKGVFTDLIDVKVVVPLLVPRALKFLDVLQKVSSAGRISIP